MTSKKHSSIICVKISQKKLQRASSYYQGGVQPAFDYFPFDRVYLARQNMLPTFKKMFRYSLSMNLSKELYTALSQIRVESTRDIPVVRDDARTEYKRVTGLDVFKTRIKNPKGWILVVPTHVRSKFRDPAKRKQPYASEVAYMLSSAVQPNHNKSAFLPGITLHTPKEDVPAMCTLCKNQAAYMANECNPGHYSCQSGHEILLDLDNIHAKAAKKSLEASGGTDQ